MAMHNIQHTIQQLEETKDNPKDNHISKCNLAPGKKKKRKKKKRESKGWLQSKV